jgi:hypothetical protein
MSREEAYELVKTEVINSSVLTDKEIRSMLFDLDYVYQNR